MLVNEWDHTRGFLDVNPRFVLGEFADYIKSSKDKKKASTTLWLIAFLYDNDSIYIDWELNEREKYLCGLLGVDIEVLRRPEVVALIDFYNKCQDTSAQRQLREWKRVMDEKSLFLRKVKYSEATYKMIEEMLASNGKLYQELERIEKVLMKEVEANRAKGGGEESLNERGLLYIDENK